MKKTILFFLVIIAISCNESPLYKQYQDIRGDWKLVENNVKLEGILQKIIFSCNPDKKVIRKDHDRLSCVGYINFNADDAITILYRIYEDKTIEIIAVTNGMDYNTTTAEVENLKKDLKGIWAMSFSEDNMFWEKQDGKKIAFVRISDS